MRFLVSAAAAAFLITAFHGAANAASCPADATKASLAVWPANSIKTGTTVNGQHPCGRAITCEGGKPNALKTRQCSWK